MNNRQSAEAVLSAARVERTSVLSGFLSLLAFLEMSSKSEEEQLRAVSLC